MSERDFVDEWITISKDIHDAPDLFIESEAYGILANVLGRYCIVVVSYKTNPIQPNIWIIFLGPSRIVRKSTAYDFIVYGTYHVIPKFSFFSDGSPEGVADAFSNAGKGGAVCFARDEMGSSETYSVKNTCQE
jgi:hypothetical protein